MAAAARWTRRRKALLGLATLWPLVYVVVFLVLPPTRLFFVAHGWKLPPGPVPAAYFGAMALHAATLAFTGILVVVYALHLASTDRVAEEQKLPWVLLLVLANVLAMPAYWVLYVWRDPPRTLPSPPRE